MASRTKLAKLVVVWLASPIRGFLHQVFAFDALPECIFPSLACCNQNIAIPLLEKHGIINL
jgi:hypothetical protein